MLEIKNLQAGIEDKPILKGIDLSVNAGEVHAIMGPNGSGKSTFASVLAGRDGYDITGGEALLQGEDLLDLAPEQRARAGVFLAFQYPVEIPGVNSAYFLRSAVNEIRKHRGEEELDAMNFLKAVKTKMKELGLSEDFLKRPVNAGFSGGEKKRFEILQMSILKPQLSILDETDSGLDIDALKVVTDGVNNLRNKTSSFLIITHYQRLLDLITPDYVHVIANGKIVKSGGKSIAEEIESSGYKQFG